MKLGFGMGFCKKNNIKKEYCLSFSESCDNNVKVNADSDFDNLSAMTIYAEVYPYSIHGSGFSGNCIISKNTGTAGFWLVLGYPKLHFKYGGYNTNAILSNEINISLNKWHKIFLIWDGSNAEFFVDGISAGGGALTRGNDPGGSKVNLGYYPNPNPQRFDGKLSNIMIFNKALKDSERANVLNETDGLIAFWKMNEGKGINVQDSSGKGHDGVLGGSSVLPEWRRK